MTKGEKKGGTMAIKDSGDRRMFDTGAVRDMMPGKGRMDLLPCSAVLELAKYCEAGAEKYGEKNVNRGIPQFSLLDSGARHLFKHLRGDEDEDHLLAALWNIAWAVNQRTEHPELVREEAEENMQKKVNNMQNGGSKNFDLFAAVAEDKKLNKKIAEAVEKQTPAGILPCDPYEGTGKCPRCGNLFSRRGLSYCSGCGQRLKAAAETEKEKGGLPQ